MEYYYLMPNNYFTKHYGPVLGGLFMHREHTNGKEKIIKVEGKRNKELLEQYTKQQPCPELKSITEGEAFACIAPIKKD